MKIVTRAAVLTSLLATVPLAAMSTTLSSQDAAFAMKAAQAGMTEVQAASVAMHKSNNRSVLSFAREMSMDHRKANTELASIVRARGMTPPATVGPKNSALLATLTAQTGSAFDKSYLRSQLPAHQQVLALFESEVADGKDSDLIAFAKSTIPVIKSHIAMDKRDLMTASAPMQMSPK